MKPEGRAYVERLCGDSPAIKLARDLTCRFFEIVRERTAGELLPWLEKTEHCRLPALRHFARSLRRDLKAVDAALTLEWSNGQTEGQVNKLKFIKRSMYGRAGFDLLRAKIVASSHSH